MEGLALGGCLFWSTKPSPFWKVLAWIILRCFPRLLAYTGLEEVVQPGLGQVVTWDASTEGRGLATAIPSQNLSKTPPSCLLTHLNLAMLCAVKNWIQVSAHLWSSVLYHLLFFVSYFLASRTDRYWSQKYDCWSSSFFLKKKLNMEKNKSLPWNLMSWFYGDMAWISYSGYLPSGKHRLLKSFRWQVRALMRISCWSGTLQQRYRQPLFSRT